MKMKNITDFVFRRQVGSKDVQSYHKSVESLLEFKATTPHANEPCELSGHCRATFLMDFSPDGSRMASSHGDHTVRITDLSTRKCTHILRGHPRTPWCLAFHQSSNDILASGCLGGEVRIWDLHGRGSEVWTAPHGSVIATLAFHPTDHVLVFATADEIYFWDWSKSRPFACCKTARNFERVRWLRFDPLGHYLYTGIANATTIQPRIHIGNRTTSGINRSSSSQTDRQIDRRLRTDFRNRRRHIQERYQEVLRQYHSYERTQPELSVSIDPPAPTIPLDEELVPYVNLVTPQSPVHEDNLRSARQYAAEISEAVRGALEIPFTRFSLRHYQERPRRQQEFLGASSQSAFYTPAPASSTSSSSLSSSSSSLSGSTAAVSTNSTSASDNDFSVGAVESLTLNDDAGYSRPSRSSESFQNGTPTPSTSGSVPTESASNRNHSDVRFTSLYDIYRTVPSEFFRPSRLLSWQPSQYIRRDVVYKSSAAGSSDQNDSESSPLPTVHSSSSSTSTSNGTTYSAASASSSTMSCTDHKKLSSASAFQSRNYYNLLDQEFNLGNTSKSSKTTASKSSSSSTSTSNGNDNNNKNAMTVRQSKTTLFKLLHSTLPSSSSTNGSIESLVPENTDPSENSLLGHSSSSTNDSKPSTSNTCNNFSTEHCNSISADHRKSIDSPQESISFMQCKRPSSPWPILSVPSNCTKCSSSSVSRNLVNGSYEKKDPVSTFSDSFAKTCCCTPTSVTPLDKTSHPVKNNKPSCSQLSKSSTSNGLSSQNTVSPTLTSTLSLFSENKSEESTNRLEPVAETSVSSGQQYSDSLTSDGNKSVKNTHSEKTEYNSVFTPTTDQRDQNVCGHSEINSSSTNQPKEKNSVAGRHFVAQNSRRLATLASIPHFPSCMRNSGNRPKRPHNSDSSEQNQQSKFPRTDNNNNNNNQSSGRPALFIPRILPLRSFLRCESSLSNRAPDESGTSSSTTTRNSVENPSLPAGSESSSRSPMTNSITLSISGSGNSTGTDMEAESNDISASQSASSPSSASINGPARTSSVSPFRSISMNNGLPRNLSDRLDACKMNLQILETLNSTYRENPSSSAAASSSSSSIPATFTPNTDSCISPPPPLPDSAAAAGCSDPSQRSTLLHNVFSSYPSTSSSSSSLPSLSSSSSSSSIETNSYLIGLPSSGTSNQYNGTLANNLPSTSRGGTGAPHSRESASATSSSSNSIKPYQRQAGSLKSAFHSICRALSMSNTSPTSTENTYTSLQTPTTSLTSSTDEELLSTAKSTCKVASTCNKRTCNLDVAVTTFTSCQQKSEMTNASAETSRKWNNDLSAEATSSSDSINADNNCWSQMSRLTPINVEAADGASSSSSSSAESHQPISPSNSSADSAPLLPPPAPPPPPSTSSNSFSSFPLSSKPIKTTASFAKEPVFCSTSQNSSPMNTDGLAAPASLSVPRTSVSTASSFTTETCCSTKPSQNKMETDVSSKDSLPNDQSISKPLHTTAGSYFNLNSVTDKVCPIESSACVTSSSSVHSPYVVTSQPQCGDDGQSENCSDLETSCLSLSGDHTPLKSSVSNQSDQSKRTQVRRPTSKTSRIKLLKSVPSPSVASTQDCKSGTSFLTKDKLRCDKDSSLSPDDVSEAGASSQITHSMTQNNQSSMHQLSPSGSTSASQSAHNPDYGPSSAYQSDPSLSLLNWDELDSSSADSTNFHSTSAMRPPSHTYDIPVFEPSSMVSNRTSSGSLPDVPGISRTCRPQGHSARGFDSPSFTIPNINDNPGAATNEAFDTLCAVASATCDITEVTARLHQELDDLDRRMASLQQRCAARLARVHVPSREVVGLERWSANHNVDEFVCSVRNTLDGIAQLRRHERLVQQIAAASFYPDDVNGRGNERLDESARLSNEAREEISRSLRREISKQTKLLRLQERILQRLRQRQIHQHYVNTTSSSEDALPRPNDTLQAAINRAIAGAFLGRGEIAVATNIINLTHRIQRWDFRKLELPDLTDISDNVIVSHCKLHNDASCDISQDGCLLATFVPTHRGFPDDTVLAIYSLQEDTLGQCLYTKGFGPNAISVSISPKNHYVLVGLAAKRISWVFTTNQMVAQVYELSQEFAGEQSMKHVNDITHYVDADMRTHVSVNSAKWLPQVGGGLVYGTNRGNLHLCWPGFKPQKKENTSERDEEWNTLNQAQSLRRNLYRVQHIRRNLINMPSVPQRLLHTTSTATQTSHRQVQRSAGTQTDGSEEEEGNWDSD